MLKRFCAFLVWASQLASVTAGTHSSTLSSPGRPLLELAGTGPVIEAPRQRSFWTAPSNESGSKCEPSRCGRRNSPTGACARRSCPRPNLGPARPILGPTSGPREIPGHNRPSCHIQVKSKGPSINLGWPVSSPLIPSPWFLISSGTSTMGAQPPQAQSQCQRTGHGG
jgi:hypothetical protein